MDGGCTNLDDSRTSSWRAHPAAKRTGWPTSDLASAYAAAQCKTQIRRAGAPIELHDRRISIGWWLQSSVPVVVDYWAPWCGPCRMVAPELQKVAARQAGKALVVKVNTDELSDLGQRFGIRSIPTLAVFAGGREVGENLRRAPGRRHRGVRRAVGRDAAVTPARLKPSRSEDPAVAIEPPPSVS